MSYYHRRLIVYLLLWNLTFSLKQISHQVQAQEVIVIDPWVIPIDNIPYPTRSAVQGDVVSFHYRGNHNVYVALNSGSADTNDGGETSTTFQCDTTNNTQDNGIQQVGATGSESANYTLILLSSSSSPSDSQGAGQNFTSVTFFCNYTSHCERGQQLQFNVYSSREDIPPTLAPSTMPTTSPTTLSPSIIPTVEVTAPPFVPLFNTTFAPTPDLKNSAAVCTSWVTSSKNLSGGIALLSLLFV